MYVSKRALRKAENEEIKRVLTEVGGSVTVAAELLGMRYKNLSRRLNRGVLLSWWTKFRVEKRKKSERESARRSRERLAARRAIENGGVPADSVWVDEG